MADLVLGEWEQVPHQPYSWRLNLIRADSQSGPRDPLQRGGSSQHRGGSRGQERYHLLPAWWVETTFKFSLTGDHIIILFFLQWIHLLCFNVFVLWLSFHKEWKSVIWQIVVALIQSFQIKSFSVIRLFRQLCNSFLCSNGHVQAFACFSFLHQQQCLKTVIEVITIRQTSSNLPLKSMLSLNDKSFSQFFSTAMAFSYSSWQCDQRRHIQFLCGSCWAGCPTLLCSPVRDAMFFCLCLGSN